MLIEKLGIPGSGELQLFVLKGVYEMGKVKGNIIIEKLELFAPRLAPTLRIKGCFARWKK